MKKWMIVCLLLVAIGGVGWYILHKVHTYKEAQETLAHSFADYPLRRFVPPSADLPQADETNDEPNMYNEPPEYFMGHPVRRFGSAPAKLPPVDETNDKPSVTAKITSTPQNTELLPTMDSPSVAKNRVWVGAFQLVWNDLMDELIKGPVKYMSKREEMAELLNKQGFSTADLSASAYYKKWGHTTPKLRQEIEQGIKEKFNETSDITGGLSWDDPDGYTLYVMLKKDFSYVEELTKLSPDLFAGSDEVVKYFGVTDGTSEKVRKSIQVLFYNNPDDFAIRLNSKEGDEVYLYRTNDDKTLDRLYADMLRKDTHKKDRVQKDDYVKIPMLDFNVMREFKELYGEIRSDLRIERAIETAKFKMDEKGVKLKAEAAMQITRGAASIRYPRYFYLNDSYVIFINEKGKKPYFAMRVTDAAALQ